MKLCNVALNIKRVRPQGLGREALNPLVSLHILKSGCFSARCTTHSFECLLDGLQNLTVE
jgi:hypothetical protein